MQQYMRYLAWLALIVGGLALTGTVMPFAQAAKATIFLVLVAGTVLGAWHLFPAAVPAAKAGKAIAAAILIVLAFGYWDDVAPFADKIGISRNLLRTSAYNHALARLEGDSYESAQELGKKCLEQTLEAARHDTGGRVTGAVLARIKSQCDAKVREYSPPPMDSKSGGGYDPRLDVSQTEPARTSTTRVARVAAPAPVVYITDDVVAAAAAPPSGVAAPAEHVVAQVNNPAFERTLRELDRKAITCTTASCVREIQSEFDSARKQYRKATNENSSFDSWLAFAPDRFADHLARGQLRDDLTQTTAALKICNPRDQDCKALAIKRAGLMGAIDATPAF